jgi:predicted GNAT family acetyltransferase
VPDRHMYEARLGDRRVGFTQYQVTDQSIALLHTEIDPDFEGRGYGSKLAAGVLADARSRGVDVVVRCPFISVYVRRHRDEYPDLDVAEPTAKAASAE